MSMLLLHTFLMLFASFVAGAAMACLFRRLFSSAAARSAPVARPVAPLETTARPAPQSSAADPAASARFERALTGDRAPQPLAQAATSGPVVEVQPLAPKIPAPAATLSAPAPSPEPVRTAAPAPPQQPITPPVRPAPPPPAPEPARQAAAAPGPAPGPSAAEIAAATAAASAAAAAAQRAMTPAPPMPAPPAPAPASAPKIAEVRVETKPVPAGSGQAAPTSYDDLTSIRAIDLALQSRLNLLGIRRYQQIAAWKPNDVNLINQSLGFSGRIEQENWIEQAQILAGGGLTDYARRKKSGGTDGAGAPPAASTPQTPPAPAAPNVAQATAAAAAVAAAAVAPTPAPKPAVAPVSPGAERPFGMAGGAPADRLHRILGVNAAAESILIANGITKYAQIAAWTPADAEHFDALVGRPGRIAKENWIEQAKILARGGSPEAEAARPARAEQSAAPDPATADAGQSSRDYSNLRSVRSEALRTDVPGGQAGRASGGTDDLKRIRGVGVLIEKKLNSLGVISYDQVANWSAADIDRISQILDFKGRIERENWVEQARILAAGGQTEFSRRVDRGEVDSSRPVR